MHLKQYQVIEESIIKKVIQEAATVVKVLQTVYYYQHFHDWICIGLFPTFQDPGPYHACTKLQYQDYQQPYHLFNHNAITISLIKKKIKKIILILNQLFTNNNLSDCEF